MRHTLDTSVVCDCGNPICEAKVYFRRGFVEINHGCGRFTQHWDYLIINAFENGNSVELMVPPKEAKRLFWFMVGAFCPGIATLYGATRALHARVSYYCYWRWV